MSKEKFERMPLTGENILRILGLESPSQISDIHLLSLLERKIMVGDTESCTASIVTHIHYDKKSKRLFFQNNLVENDRYADFNFPRSSNGLTLSIKKEKAENEE